MGDWQQVAPRKFIYGGDCLITACRQAAMSMVCERVLSCHDLPPCPIIDGAGGMMCTGTAKTAARRSERMCWRSADQGRGG